MIIINGETVKILLALLIFFTFSLYKDIKFSYNLKMIWEFIYLGIACGILINLFNLDFNFTAKNLNFETLLTNFLSSSSEEIIFRGLILKFFLRIWRFEFSVFISSIFFAAIHPNISLFNYLAVFLCSLVISWVYKKNGLIAAIFTHTIGNIMANLFV